MKDKLNLTFRVLGLFNRGFYAKQIADKLKISSARVSQVKSWLEKNGYITREVRSSVMILKLTERGENAIKKHKLNLTPYRMHDKSEAHDIFIKIPILKRPPSEIEGFWDSVNDKLPNQIQRFKTIRKPHRITWRETISKGKNSLCIQASHRPLKSVNEVTNLVNRLTFYTVSYFADLGYVLDWGNTSLENIHITTRDEDSMELSQKGNQFKVFLGRPRSKFYPKDPKQEAYVEIDGTPNPEGNWESNDRKHAELRAVMPEMVNKMLMLQERQIEQMSVYAEHLNAHIPVLKGMDKLLKKLDKRISQRSLKEFPECSKNKAGGL